MSSLSSVRARRAVPLLCLALGLTGAVLTSPAPATATVTVTPTTTTPTTTRPTTTTPTTTTTTLTATAHPLAGVPTTLVATVSPAPGGASTAGSVAFRTGSATISGCASRAVDPGTGQARCSAEFPNAGPKSLTAAYSGVAGAYGASSGSTNVTVVTATAGQIVGGTGGCTTTKGALVAVGFAPWHGPIVRGCDPDPSTGIALLHTAGFTTTGTQHDGPGFICRLGHPLFDRGTQYPTPAQDACVNTPPASAYWSYWVAAKGVNSWHYSPTGAYANMPAAGEVQAWVYGGTDVAGSSGQPSFSPNQVRTQASAPNTAPPAAAGPAVGAGAASAPAAGAQAVSGSAARAQAVSGPDLTAAVHYLATTTGANGVPDGTSLAAEGYYESYDRFADYGLTLDGAFALAATGTDDSALRTVLDFVLHGRDGSQRSIDDWTGIGTRYASGGSLGKEALLAEVTGYDPHTFGGHDLVAALDASVCPGAAATDGCAAAGNYRYATSVFSQALGVIAQLRAGDAGPAARPIAYLAGLQDASGGFPALIPGAGTDVDSTAIAAMALDLAGGPAPAVARALRWLADRQQADGGFPGSAGDSTNSAALAVQGLTLGGATYAGAVARATAFLATQQNGDGGFAVAAGGQRGSDVRASTQVVGGLVGTSFGTLRDDVTAVPVTAPSGDAGNGPTAGSTAPGSAASGSAASGASASGSASGASASDSAGSSLAAAPAAASGSGDGGSASALASTGMPTLALVLAALALLLAGVALSAAGRRHPHGAGTTGTTPSAARHRRHR